jgi:hypothetical protein
MAKLEIVDVKVCKNKQKNDLLLYIAINPATLFPDYNDFKIYINGDSIGKSDNWISYAVKDIPKRHWGKSVKIAVRKGSTGEYSDEREIYIPSNVTEDLPYPPPLLGTPNYKQTLFQTTSENMTMAINFINYRISPSDKTGYVIYLDDREFAKNFLLYTKEVTTWGVKVRKQFFQITTRPPFNPSIPKGEHNLKVKAVWLEHEDGTIYTEGFVEPPLYLKETLISAPYYFKIEKIEAQPPTPPSGTIPQPTSETAEEEKKFDVKKLALPIGIILGTIILLLIISKITKKGGQNV